MMKDSITIFTDSWGGGTDVVVPLYLDLHDRVRTLWSLPESLALLDYLWENGAFHDYPESDSRYGWNVFVFSELIEEPIIQALCRSSLEQVVESRTVEAWAIDHTYVWEKGVREKIEEQIEALSGRQTYYALCPLIGVALNEAFDLPAGVRLVTLSNIERSQLASDFRFEFAWYDSASPFMHRVAARIEVIGSPTRIGIARPDRQDLAEMVARKLDLLKWAISTAAEVDPPPGEGACLIRTRSGFTVGMFSRDRDISRPVADASALKDEIVTSMSEYLEVEQIYPDLGIALWYFGRSCTSNIDRDVLLEGAIGLDSLFSTGGGDSRYRFCLHGTAILTRHRISSGLYSKLGAIYTARSGAAHGGPAPGKLGLLPTETRGLLAAALVSVVKMSKSGELASNCKSIPKAVEAYVIEKVTGRK